MTKRRPSNRKPAGVNKSLGNSLANSKEKSRHSHRQNGAGADGFENPAFMAPTGDTKNIDSVTEETALEEFLAKAQLAGTEFAAERGRLTIESGPSVLINRVPTKQEFLSNKNLQAEYADKLKIPRRPALHSDISAAELEKRENEQFLEWRRALAELQEVDGLILTPFERNLELWRQLWRVVERSDIIVQIVDARNPLMFRSADLERYVLEMGPGKQNLLLINKSDYLTSEQVQIWAQYFADKGIRVVFWSAAVDQENGNKEEEGERASDQNEDGDSESSDYSSGDEDDETVTMAENAEPDTNEMSKDEEKIENTVMLTDPADLLQLFKNIGGLSATSDCSGGRPLVVGMVGYPNVGKSSTINKLVGSKKVAVSATPGKTRHFQTLHVDDQLILCDCPGLVMPSFAMSRNEMILNGILSADQLHDYLSPTTLLLSKVPRNVLEHVYGIMLPKHGAGSQPPPTAQEFLSSVAFIRGFMSSNGVPDCSRAARLVMKDVVNGKMKWAACPDGCCDQQAYDQMTYSLDGSCSKPISAHPAMMMHEMEKRRILESKSTTSKGLDKDFFKNDSPGFHVISRGGAAGSAKPWRAPKKAKKDKLRRVYKDLNG